MGSSGGENKRKEHPCIVYTWRAAQRGGRPPQLQGPPGHCHLETRIRLQPGSQGLALEILPAVGFEERPPPLLGSTRVGCSGQRPVPGHRHGDAQGLGLQSPLQTWGPARAQIPLRPSSCGLTPAAHPGSRYQQHLQQMLPRQN